MPLPLDMDRSIAWDLFFRVRAGSKCLSLPKHLASLSSAFL